MFLSAEYSTIIERDVKKTLVFKFWLMVTYEVAELLNLQTMRDNTRLHR